MAGRSIAAGVCAYPLILHRREKFRIASALRSSTTSVNVYLRLENDNGTVSWGNACPSRSTNETLESVFLAMERISTYLKEQRFEGSSFLRKLIALVPKDSSVIAAFDIAYHDMKAKDMGVPLYKLFGNQNHKVLTDSTIGIKSLEESVREAKIRKNAGFRALKLKVGLDLKNDIQRVTAIRNAVGPNTMLWIDGNQAFSPDKSIILAQEVEPLDIKFIEQPVPAKDLKGLKRVRKSTSIPIVADEAVHTAKDAIKVFDFDAADMVNIKLMKCAGLHGALDILEVCEKYRTNAIIGCMGESLLSIAAAVHLASACNTILYSDLDSHFNLKDDCAKGIEFRDGYHIVPRKPGLGLTIDKNAISQRQCPKYWKKVPKSHQ